MLPPPLKTRRNIPFYTHKTEANFRADPYEHYDQEVVKQMTLHLGFPTHYPWQPLEDWMFEQLDHYKETSNILEVGCGIGKLIGKIATTWPQHQCYGFDYSYQMLKVADDYYRSSKALSWRHTAFANDFEVAARPPLSNLHLGLAAAETLPFPDESIDVLINSFLLDRLSEPVSTLTEWRRVLSPQGIMLTASPLNFQQQRHWKDYYPFEKLATICKDIGFELPTYPETLLLRQPIDQHKNILQWRCLVWKMHKH